MRACEFKKIAGTPESLYDAVPKTFERNLIFRKDLHMYLMQDTAARTDFLALAFLDPRIFFDTCLWCPGTEMWAKSRNMPFILHAKQEEAVMTIKNAIDHGGDVAVNKSRKQGATFLICGTGLIYWLLVQGFQFLLGSRVEKLVDTSSEIINGIVAGQEKSLFYKILYMLNTIPDYLKPQFRKSHLFLQNMDNGSSMAGEATDIGFGLGSRAPFIMVDEFAAIEPKLADTIIRNLSDVGACCVFNSTQGYWAGAHPYDYLISSGRATVVNLWYWDNPMQNEGLYNTPAEGKIVITDLDYYKRTYPGKFDHVEVGVPFDVQTVAGTYPFVADGGVSVYGAPRSVWIDEDFKRPGRTLRGIAQNMLGLAAGARDSFFDLSLVDTLKEQAIEPEVRGDIHYDIVEGEIQDVTFTPGGTNSLLSWWGSLDPNRRPNQRHRYVVGCDISRGTGSSNSVAAILDVNQREIVGLLVTAHHRIEQFAELVVALCEWIGGTEPPLLIWEKNGASEFRARIDELGYYSRWKKPGKFGDEAEGWLSTSGPNGTKMRMLNQLDSALHEGLRPNSQFDTVKLRDSNTINELSMYVFFDGRIDVGMISTQMDTSGAKAAHGDRVIAVGLAVLAAAGETPGQYREPTTPIASNTFAARMEAVRLAEQANAREKRIWVF